MRNHVSPRQVAQALGVSESSVKRWVDRGLLPAERTAGGHRRLPVAGVVRFLRDNGHELVRPELLRLPARTRPWEGGLGEAREELAAALDAEDEPRFRRAVVDLYLAGHPATEICDRAIAPAFHSLGELWQHGALEIYQERRGCEICARVLHELRSFLPEPGRRAPSALGGALEGDWYTLPTAMVEIALAEGGWKAGSLGPNLPPETLQAALRQHRPRLFWLSVSYVSSRDELRESFERIHRSALATGTALVAGGRELTEELRRELSYSAYCDDLKRLVAFAATLAPDLPTHPLLDKDPS